MRMHPNRLGNHAIEVDCAARADATVCREREGSPQTFLTGRGIVAESVVEVEDDGFWSRIKWLRRHLVRLSWARLQGSALPPRDACLPLQSLRPRAAPGGSPPAAGPERRCLRAAAGC